MLLIREILQITEGKALRLDKPEAAIHHLLLDSRKISFTENALFFAVKGERHNGHQFIEEIYFKGVRDFIIEEEPGEQKGEKRIFPFSLLEHPLETNVIQVKNSIDALQKIAAFHRQKFNYPIIGITGSNGKTIVKEWLYHLLSPDYNIVKSPKSYNSQVGVPLSVWQMNEKHNLAIFEAGISKPDEMEKLQKIIQPTIGIFTNIGTAHEEGFENSEQKIAEKLKLFKDSEVIYSLHAKSLEQKPYHLIQNFKLLFTEVKNSPPTSSIDFEFESQKYKLNLPFTDNASFENALSCLMILLHFKIPIVEMQERFLRLKPVSMRLELKQGISNNYVIDDSYNNDLAGLDLALNFLVNQKQKNKTVVILSDLGESNPIDDEKLYDTIGGMMERLEIDEFVGIGEKMFSYQDFFKPRNPLHTLKLKSSFFKNTGEFIKNPLLQSFAHSLILVKGARKFEFEKIVQRLQQKTHQTVMEINLDALVHNLNFYKNLLKPGTKIMVMVKAFAYGSGSVEVTNLLQYHRVDYLGVAYADEGIFLRKNGIHLPIMVMNPDAENFEQLLEFDLEPEIYSFKLLFEFLDFCKSCGKNDFKIHLKIDTGMRRLGFEWDEIDKLIEVLEQKMPWAAQVVSILSHIAGADEEEHNQFSSLQIKRFKECAEKIENALGYNTLKHILNSPGIVRFPEAHLDMVRLGIGLYGIETNQLLQNKLEVVTTLKTSISQIKYIKAGETVGYGRNFTAEKDMKIATIAIGYADGFSRKLSNGVGKVQINGDLSKVIGRVCMDMTMVDISGIEAEEGDEVIIFGKEISIIDFAKSINTIPYEVLTSMGERVKRVFYTA